MATILLELVELFLGHYGNNWIGNASGKSCRVYQYNCKWQGI